MALLCIATASKAKDIWLGCWRRVYDADHLAKHQAQEVTAIGVAVLAGDKLPATKYLAKVQVRLGDKPETYTNVHPVHCRKAGTRLQCLAADKSRENFWRQRSGADLQLRLTAARGRGLVPPNNPTGFVQLQPQNPEYQLFILKAPRARGLHALSAVRSGWRRRAGQRSARSPSR